MRKIVSAIFLVSFILCVGCTKNNNSSGLKFVNDQAGILSKAEKDHITELNNALLRDMDIHIMVIVELSRYAAEKISK